ncbi:MAG TPA: GAF domain-containing protein, partial [Desulfobaccales bacterium]|nr:GAF domain-containing protein [Desulfobaccales bacterium]
MPDLIYSRQDLRQLVKLSSLINSSLDPGEALNNALMSVELQLNAEVSSIYGVDKAKGELFFLLVRGPGAEKLKSLRLTIGEGIAGWVAQTEKPLICPTPYSDGRFARQLDNVSGFQTRSILCVPLRSRDRLMGVLEVLNKKDGQGFSDDDLEFLIMLGNMIGPALENAELYSRLREKLTLTVEELKVVEKKLLQTERLAALGKLSQGVAHEVRNPVMIIGGFARRLQKRLPAEDQVQEMIVPILHETRRLEQMVAEIEAFAGLLEPDLKPRDLAKIVDQVLAARAAALQQLNITVQCQVHPDLPQIPLDENLMNQTLNLLIDNAAEAMPQGGQLTLAVTPEPNGVRLTLQDTGIGIAAEDLPYIFDPFFSSKP